VRYIFMDNFRGFSRAVIPIGKATFLVGENSTGKTSLMSLVSLMSTLQLVMSHGFSLTDAESLGGFNDIVSFTSKVKNKFTIGMFATTKQPKETTKKGEYTFALFTFRNEEGMPRISRYVQYSNDEILKITFFPKTISFKTIKMVQNAMTDDKFIEFALRVFDEDSKDRRGFRNLPKDILPEMPIGYYLGAIQSLDRQKKKEQLIFVSGIPLMMGITWIAPIRTKPKRTYEAFKTGFTPEGNHTPYVIRKTLESREKAEEFTRLLHRFGQSSGLFTKVEVHPFGKDPSAPFEVRIEIIGGKLNISNVGYGVSQVLPVVVEMLTRPKGHWFVIQQPEIHLHPRAQAALGDLIHTLVKKQKHNYIIETHSEYLIDRFRFNVKKSGGPAGCRVIYFERTKSGNTAHILPIDVTGKYPKDQPRAFKRFFIDEEMKLLEI
jgi:predicted ATPase